MRRNYKDSTVCAGIFNARSALLMVLSLVMVMASAGPIMAHGTKFEYQAQTSYEITAAYDDGSPMAEAQVTVYAPNEPSQPWTTGTCDDQGHYVLTPDTSIPGEWVIQIRKAGHGGMINIPIGESDAAAAAGSNGYTPVQLAVMIVAVLWGLVGTALYFKREKK